jgi:hypothetical protein
LYLTTKLKGSRNPELEDWDSRRVVENLMQSTAEERGLYIALGDLDQDSNIEGLLHDKELEGRGLCLQRV